MIKIAIDTSSISKKYGIRGVGFYTQRLIEAFKKIRHEGIIIEPLELRRLSPENLNQYSLVHYPYFDPFFLTLPINKIKPTVVTVHDLIPLKFPKRFPKGIRGWLKWQIQKSSLKSASAIITDSYSSKKDIIKIIGYEEKKIFPIYLASDAQFKILNSSELKRILRKYNLPECFILYVGDLNWNKNIPGLLKSFANICKIKENIYLVLVGKAFINKALEERVKTIQLIKQLKIYNKVKILGFMPTKDLTGLYNLATCLCLPSFYEGFGLPVLEAMACGCPVICSQNSSLAEVADEAAFFIDPDKPGTIIEAIKKVLTDETIRTQLREKGLNWVRNFSWEKTAGQTLAVYKEILNEE